MSWERYQGARTSSTPVISFRGRSQIGLNSEAIKEFKLEQYQWVILFFDKDGQRIGLRPTNNKREMGVCKLRVKPPSGASISAGSFIKEHHLGEGSKRRFAAIWDDTEKMIVVDLREA